jgi:hypothetical protein
MVWWLQAEKPIWQFSFIESGTGGPKDPVFGKVWWITDQMEK